MEQGQVGSLRREISALLGRRVPLTPTAWVPRAQHPAGLGIRAESLQHLDNVHSICFCVSARSFPSFGSPLATQVSMGRGWCPEAWLGRAHAAPHTAVSCSALDSSFFLFILQKPWSPQKQAKVNWGITWSRRGVGAAPGDLSAAGPAGISVHAVYLSAGSSFCSR